MPGRAGHFEVSLCCQGLALLDRSAPPVPLREVIGRDDGEDAGEADEDHDVEGGQVGAGDIEDVAHQDAGEGAEEADAAADPGVDLRVVGVAEDGADEQGQGDGHEGVLDAEADRRDVEDDGVAREDEPEQAEQDDAELEDGRPLDADLVVQVAHEELVEDRAHGLEGHDGGGEGRREAHGLDEGGRVLVDAAMAEGGDAGEQEQAPEGNRHDRNLGWDTLLGGAHAVDQLLRVVAVGDCADDPGLVVEEQAAGQDGDHAGDAHELVCHAPAGGPDDRVDDHGENGGGDAGAGNDHAEIGRASCRERV